MKFATILALSGTVLAGALLAASVTTAQPGGVQLAQAKACFASDPDSQGATELERSFRAAIRKSFEHDAAPGADGKQTIGFQSVKIGAKRAWAVPDQASFATGDQTKPIYDVRVVFNTCIDYRASITVEQRERNFVCFMDQFAEVSCQMTTAGTTPDKIQSIPK